MSLAQSSGLFDWWIVSYGLQLARILSTTNELDSRFGKNKSHRPQFFAFSLGVAAPRYRPTFPSSITQHTTPQSSSQNRTRFTPLSFLIASVACQLQLKSFVQRRCTQKYSKDRGVEAFEIPLGRLGPACHCGWTGDLSGLPHVNKKIGKIAEYPPVPS